LERGRLVMDRLRFYVLGAALFCGLASAALVRQILAERPAQAVQAAAITSIDQTAPDDQVASSVQPPAIWKYGLRMRSTSRP
jgi:hypothetical protein